LGRPDETEILTAARNFSSIPNLLYSLRPRVRVNCL
jgi:hypothetical protein